MLYFNLHGWEKIFDVSATTTADPKKLDFVPLFPNFDFSVKPDINNNFKLLEKNERLRERIESAIRNNKPQILSAIFANIPPQTLKSLINEPDENEYTPLLLCGLSGADDCMNLLLKAGANPLYTNSYGENFLHFATKKGHYKLLRSFAENFSNALGFSETDRQFLLDSADNEGFTPLLNCALSGSIDCMNLLLDNGVSKIKRNAQDKIFTHIAIEHNRPAMLKAFLERCSNPEKGGSRHLGEFLVNAPTEDELSPLLQCAISGNLECMELLLKNGADLTDRNAKGANFLYLAVKYEQIELLEKFLTTMPAKDIANLINQGNFDGNTPLHECANTGNLRCLNLLIDAGADLMALNKDNRDVYTLSLKYQHLDFTKALYQREPKLKGFFVLYILTHVFGIEPRVTFKKEDKKSSIKIDNGFYAKLMHEQILQILNRPFVQKELEANHSPQAYKELVVAFSKACIRTPSVDELAEDIRSGKLVVIPTGWSQHCIDLVFRDGYLVICNRGEGSDNEFGESRTLFARKIALDQITGDLIQSIFDKKNVSLKIGEKFFYQELPNLLDAQEDAFCRDLYRIAPKDSKAGVCTYAAGKAAIRVALALIIKKPTIAKNLSKKWATWHRYHTLALFEKTLSPLTVSSSIGIIETARERLKKRRVINLETARNRLRNRHMLES